ncbi:MAG: A/G-specific adenine glycosylase [Cryomorphaceae bacterium]|nr:A/G-specific adenine glycosylase [Flavobacteriales bacterium]
MNISEPLISWYLQNKRDLPWRDTDDPYKIWLSEIILQQTRVDQGMEYYLRFVNTYPNIGFLSKAKRDDVLKNWQGLGYYSRARNLHDTAIYIDKKLDGNFPSTYDSLLDLKGVGPYTAAAIASFAFKLPHAVVDGNVSRVLSRIFDIDLAINGTEGIKTINSLAAECLNREHPDLHNQAIMELGALICTPQNPGCNICPLRSHCLARRRKTTSMRPVKIKKAKQKLRYIHYAVLENENGIVFRSRIEKDIWQGLNDFVSLEGQEELSPIDFAAHLKGEFEGMNIDRVPGAPEFECTHQLTHRRIEAKFWRFRVSGNLPKGDIYKLVERDDIEAVAVPVLVHKYLRKSGWV